MLHSRPTDPRTGGKRHLRGLGITISPVQGSAQELFFTPGLLVKIIPATGLQELDGPVQGVPEMLRPIFSRTIFVRVAG